jgi:threonine/homoserine/homoserine lactone efflux protein
MQALTANVAPARPSRIPLDDVVVGATNLKSLLLFGAILPAIRRPGSGRGMPAQLFVLGLVCVLLALLCDVA